MTQVATESNKQLATNGWPTKRASRALFSSIDPVVDYWTATTGSDFFPSRAGLLLICTRSFSSLTNGAKTPNMSNAFAGVESAVEDVAVELGVFGLAIDCAKIVFSRISRLTPITSRSDPISIQKFLRQGF